MSNDPQAFDADISTGDTSLFAPLLQEDLTELPPPFTITNRLTRSDFPEQDPDEAPNTFLSDLESIEEYFEQGYFDDPDRDLCLTLDKNQFIRGTAQTMAAIMKGICSTFPLNDSPSFLCTLGPDELASFKVLAKAVGSLNHYLTNPTALNPERWQQCLCCLQVAHVSITEDDWWAHFQTANQNAAAARQMILNTTIRNFSAEALRRVDADRARAWDQIVTWVVTANPPPFDADPRVLEWIECEATRLCTNAEKWAFTRAEQKAQIIHEQQKAVIQSHLEADLTLLRDETDKALDVARQRAQQELADLKAQIRAQREQTKTDLQDEETRAARKERTARPKNHPNPVRAIAQSHSSSIAPVMPIHLEMPTNQPTPSLYSIDGDETQHARMLIDSAPDVKDTNSPTPMADVPLAVPSVASASPPDLVMAILTAIQAQIAQTDAHLTAIETGKTKAAANNYNAWGEEYGFDPSLGVREVG